MVLGAIQGLTEFLPVSSSAHLALAHWLFGWRVPGELELAFDVVLHAGTLVALLVYFRKDWVAMIAEPAQRRFVGLVLLACVPGGVAGLLLEQKAGSAFRDPLQIAVLLALMGVLMGVADCVCARKRLIEATTLIDALWIGGSQALALMPGVSRSGITITAGRMRGFTREAAARFSFLLSMPIIAGATLWKGRHFGELTAAGVGLPLLAGVLTSAVFGYLAIDLLMRFLQRHSLLPFAVYRIVLAMLVVGVYLVRGGQ